MAFDELSSDQLQQLAETYLVERQASASWGELACAMQIVGIDALREEYGAVVFSEDDFS